MSEKLSNSDKSVIHAWRHIVTASTSGWTKTDDEVFNKLFHLIESHVEPDRKKLSKAAQKLLIINRFIKLINSMPENVQQDFFRKMAQKLKPDEKQMEELVERKAEELRGIVKNWILAYQGQLGPVAASQFDAEYFIHNLLKETMMLSIDKGWLPTAENINVLPEPIRHYIAKLETNCDPSSLVQENIILKDTCKALNKMKKALVELSHIDKLLAHFTGQPDDLGREYVIDWLKEIGVEFVDGVWEVEDKT